MNKIDIIYQIYRACRLCGAGAGYKMPIIQSVIDFDGVDIELKQKIRDCVQIEINPNDRMPPLICELCVDKIDDFYEFRRMCQDTNKKTRLRLGLPMQTVSKDTPSKEESILGTPGPVMITSDSDDGEPLSCPGASVRSKPKPKSAKTKNEAVKIRIENFKPVIKQKSHSPSPEVIERRETRRQQASKRTSRQNKSSDDFSLSELQGLQIQKPSPKAGLKSSKKSVERRREIEKEKDSDDEDKTEDISLSGRKRLREVVETPAPPVKKVKSAPEPPQKLDKTSKPGPKSSKEPKPPPPQKQPQKPPQKAGPKSKKRDRSPSPPPQPQPKSKKPQELPTTAPTSKSKKPEVQRLRVPSPAPKSKESGQTLTSRTKKPDPPAPKSKKRDESPLPTAPVRASPPPQKSLYCQICGIRAKTSQGLISHTKTHTPTFTQLKLACNPCELWFCSPEEAARHHRRHEAAGQPYTCNKCYDDFRTTEHYDLHLTRNQCIRNYEVPDVKCDDCWKYFPTYKLLEDHICGGEGNRPGGKCDKCKRTYTLQKHLIAHEMRCVSKKKAEPVVDPKVSKSLLPMQVRLAKCDLLLKNQTDGFYNVSRLSHRFGLDCNYSYPYLNSMGDVDVESKTDDHTPILKDDNKNEYFNTDDSFANWDSVDSDVSDKSDYLSSCASKTSVETLSSLSIKTLFSTKCLGKLSRKKRKDISVKGFASILNIDFNADIRNNINSIIGILGDESKNSDNYDSDSILDVKKPDSDVSDAIDHSKSNLVIDMAPPKESVEKHRDNEPNTISNKVEDKSNLSKTENNTRLNSKDDDTDVDLAANENKQSISKDDAKNGKLVSNKLANEKEALFSGVKAENRSQGDETKNMDVDEDLNASRPETLTEYKNIEISELKKEKSFPTYDNSEIETNNKEQDSPSSDAINDKLIDDLNNEKDDSQSSASIDFIPIHGLNNEKDDSRSSDAINDKIDDSSNEKDESQSHTAINCISVHDINNAKEDSQSSASIKYTSVDDFNNENDNTQSSDAISYKPTDDDLNAEKNNSQSSEAITFKEDELSNKKDDSQLSFVTDDRNHFAGSENDEKSEVPNSISFKDGIFTADSNTKSIQNADRFNIDNLNEEERQLMEEIDAQIGENETKTDAVGQNSSDVIGGNKTSDIDTSDSGAVIGYESFDTLIQKQNADLRSLDLDSISDEEFDFDL